MSKRNEQFLREAIRLASDNVKTGGGGPFGAVVVKDNKIVGKGSNKVTTTADPTAHAEIEAIRDACKNLGTHILENCTIYSSCEPCPMCLGAIYWAHLDRLYFAATRQDAANAGFDDEWMYEQIKLSLSERKLPSTNLLRSEAVKVFDDWRLSETKIPY